MYAFPDAYPDVGADVEVVGTVAVGIGDGLRDKFFDGHVLRIASGYEELRQLLEVGGLGEVGESLSVLTPMDLSVAQADACALPVDIFLETYDASVGDAYAKAIAVLVGQVDHHRYFRIVEIQLVGSSVEAEMLVDGVAFVGAFLVEEHFEANVHPTGDGD